MWKGLVGGEKKEKCNYITVSKIQEKEKEKVENVDSRFYLAEIKRPNPLSEWYQGRQVGSDSHNSPLRGCQWRLYQPDIHGNMKMGGLFLFSPPELVKSTSPTIIVTMVLMEVMRDLARHFCLSHPGSYWQRYRKKPKFSLATY